MVTRHREVSCRFVVCLIFGRCNGKREFVAIGIAIDLIALMRAGSAERAGCSGRVANGVPEIYRLLPEFLLEVPGSLLEGEHSGRIVYQHRLNRPVLKAARNHPGRHAGEQVVVTVAAVLTQSVL